MAFILFGVMAFSKNECEELEKPLILGIPVINKDIVGKGYGYAQGFGASMKDLRQS